MGLSSSEAADASHAMAGDAIVDDAPAQSPATAPVPAPIPALQVIVLGSGGGPLENNVTAFLVRSVASGWARGSVVAVDAGVHLSAIKTILEQTQPAKLGQPGGPALPHTLTTGPFAGLEVHHATADANAAEIHKTLIETYLITHPHLDHIAGFVINTAGLSGSRPKKVAGLPSTITALKTHVFNNVIWPNLSDENNGAGLVTYMRLVEGGSPALGEGEGRGYLEVCCGLAVKAWSVSHGHCIERHSHRGSSSTRHGSFDASSMGPAPPQVVPTPSRNLPQHTSLPTNMGAYLQQHERIQSSPASRRGSAFSIAPPIDDTVCVYDSSVYFVRDLATGREILIFGDVEPDSISLSPRNRQVWQEVAPRIVSGDLAAIFIECSYDDSRCDDRLFGHLTPRFVCEEMIALAEEVIALRLEKERIMSGGRVGAERKRKRLSDEGSLPKRKGTPQPRGPISAADIPLSPRSIDPSWHIKPAAVNPVSASTSDFRDRSQDRIPKTILPTHPLRCTTTVGPNVDEAKGQGQDATSRAVPEPSPTPMSAATSATAASTAVTPLAVATSQLHLLQQENDESHSSSSTTSSLRNALRGLQVVVIHVKETMLDGPSAGNVILEELRAHERETGLGIEFSISEAGSQYFF
ncbi:cAMP phosphodiesterases class-II-domain-containing protein [Thermothelomyces heterothallicus CBS 202.75]|uniref:cAMP phosphodiesterases class-II-domain-containing protein n=1 Tax=Thermothelomyces heterothallicus CBS 202.75 TaxID=1149848 RepID=UPI0037433029